ncbi:MAG TPA: hypothetical protein VNI58_07990 [Mariprofundaceae bacterium]|nr:hypothetical protein [Mariprofundaceae bacterium]
MAIMYTDQAETKLEMLKWLSEKNRHVPLAELAFMLDMPIEEESPHDDSGTFDWN